MIKKLNMAITSVLLKLFQIIKHKKLKEALWALIVLVQHPGYIVSTAVDNKLGVIGDNHEKNKKGQETQEVPRGSTKT